MKLIIDISDEIYQEALKSGYSHLYDEDVANAVAEGIPLDNNSERAEVQAYFDGEAYGWEQGRKALIDDVKAEIADIYCGQYCENPLTADAVREMVLDILDKIGKESEEEV